MVDFLNYLSSEVAIYGYRVPVLALIAAALFLGALAMRRIWPVILGCILLFVAYLAEPLFYMLPSFEIGI